MTQEEKKLLIKDLCSRLPYEVKVKEDIQGDFTLIGLTKERVFTTCEVEGCHNDFPIELIKPYLFPLYSMTEEQKKEYNSIIYSGIELHSERYYDVIDIDEIESLEEFYNKNHLDFRGLIRMNMAIDATGLNIY